jgi:hypothetical protein
MYHGVILLLPKAVGVLPVALCLAEVAPSCGELRPKLKSGFRSSPVPNRTVKACPPISEKGTDKPVVGSGSRELELQFPRRIALARVCPAIVVTRYLHREAAGSQRRPAGPHRRNSLVETRQIPMA